MQGPGLPVALFRIMFGILWLDLGWSKAPWLIGQEGHRFGWLYGWIQQEIKHPTFGFYKAFLENVVVPNFNFFGYMTFFTEIALGLSLFLGLFTVLGGLGGALWQVNIALGSYSVPGEWYWVWPLLIAPHLIFAACRAGRILGIDGFLLSRISRQEKGPAGIVHLLFRLA
ncbi:MAG: DoxX family membrane protein [Candidatus Rokubacteria bacterium]|nr:DoxX family membrane protein [Candidatus Rokubacteria bacterium]